MNSPKLSEKSRSHSLKRPSLPSTQSNSQDNLTDDSTTAILDRVKPDRAASSKPEEDRRRRTIIVEKKNGTYGFTLQSYGIHYKKEQEIEMITYVDYVEYDGPAYKAGMREGDVILSINGHDMEKADHKALVNFIKKCDTRMRMVVLFEDCVRKVELHIRYIQLQRLLQSKTAELDRLCLRERELLQGKWKTHSLPARKKGQPEVESPTSEGYSRPTVSTENVAQGAPHQLLFAYQYVDPRYQYAMQTANNSSDCLLTWHQDDTRRVFLKTNSDASRRNAAKGYHQANGVAAAETETKSRGRHKQRQQSRHLCNPCIQANTDQDNNSLEAYDLASPCCDTHCVPSTKRKQRHHKHHAKGQDQDRQERQERHSAREKSESRPPHSHRHKYFNFGSSLVSQCSLHSCGSSEASGPGHGTQRAGESSAASYTTSLSTDTLYWEGAPEQTRQHSTKSHSNKSSNSSKIHLVDTADGYQSYNPAKPKSWDNLTTKAFGGYGFGYGYLDPGTSAKSVACGSSSGICNTMPSNSKSGPRANSTKVTYPSTVLREPTYSTTHLQVTLKGVKAETRLQGVQIYHGGHYYFLPPNKSSESLLLLPKQDSTLSDSSLSCDCLDLGSPGHIENMQRFFPTATIHVGRDTVETVFYHRDKASQTEVKQRRSLEQAASGTEVTRL